MNEREGEPLPRLLPTHAAGDGFPLRLQPATTPFALNSSFYEQDDLRSRQTCMELIMNPADAEVRGLVDGRQVLACNRLGEVGFTLKVSERVPAGTVSVNVVSGMDGLVNAVRGPPSVGPRRTM